MTESESKNLPSSGKVKTQNAREEILKHARLLFRQKGFTAVSMNELVASVGLTKPTIYYHFCDKETLFAEVLVEMMRHGNELFSTSIKRSKTRQEKLYRLCEGYLRFSPTSLSTLIRDATENLSETHLKNVMEAHRFYLVMPITAIFTEGIRENSVNTGDPEQLALFFISWIDAMTTLKTAYDGRDFDAKTMAQTLTHIYLNGITKSV